MTAKRTVTLSKSEALKILVEAVRTRFPATGEEAGLEIEVIIDDPETRLHASDVGIVIALKEEFDQIFPKIKADHFYKKDVSQYFYIFEHPEHNKRYRCVVAFVGGIGAAKAALVGERLMSEFSPTTIVNIGIAGSMDREALVGDIVVAEQSDDYLASARAVAGKGRAKSRIKFVLSGDPYKTTEAFVQHANNMSYAYGDAFGSLIKECCLLREGLLTPEQLGKLYDGNMLRPIPKLMTGRIASGPILGGTELFVEWLKQSRDRKYVALEMESAGVLAAAHARGIQTLIIRGVSDFSDERKKLLDSFGNGALRRYAMNNAVLLLWRYLELGLLV